LARRKIRDGYLKYYDESMTALFKEAPEYLTGPNNVYLLNASLSSSFPELAFVDSNDDNWKLSSLERKNYPLPDDGRLMAASVSGFNFYKIKRPLSVPLEKIDTEPRYIMDLILQNIRTERTLWGSEAYRILSFGDPASVGEYRDEMGRIWITAYWPIGFSDDVQIMFILPLPNGPVVITTLQDSSLRIEYEWDMQKTCDHTYAAYDAAFDEWDDFLAMEKYIPDFLGDLRFNWRSGNQSFSLQCGPLSISADTQVFDWAGDSEMFLAPSWYKEEGTLEFGIRKVIFNRDVRGKEFIVLYRNIKPDSILGSGALENWNDLAAEKYPFDGRPGISAKDNTGSVGAIIRAQRPRRETLFSLYLSMENPQNEETINRRFTALKGGIAVRE
jgi:hypothetical protein